MAMTHSDGATASQKCDPYAVGFEECENFLRGEEDLTDTCTSTHTHTHTHISQSRHSHAFILKYLTVSQSSDTVSL